jgi:putative ABC transport system permease protein
LEATSIAALGTVCGYAVYAAILAGVAIIIRAQTGVVLDVMQFNSILFLTPVIMIILGAIAGVIPAFKAYATDVATNIAPIS